MVETTVTAEDSSAEPGAIMSALSDTDCREILVATSDASMSVAELVDECAIPMATAYRKVERLVELDLLEERIRVRPRGRNSREYRLRAEAIHIAIPDQQTPAITFSCTIGRYDSAENQTAEIWTDGGQLSSEDSEYDQQRRLRKIFEDVTGTVAFVETQKRTQPRYSDDDQDTAVSEYVAATAKEDGLSDAIATPEMSEDVE